MKEKEISKDMFSPRQIEVIERIVLGWTNDKIAKDLHLSRNTVKSYIAIIFKKLNVTTRAEIAYFYGKAYNSSDWSIEEDGVIF